MGERAPHSGILFGSPSRANLGTGRSPFRFLVRALVVMSLSTGAKAFRSRPPDAQLPVREHHETAGEGIESFRLNDRLYAAQERVGAGLT